MNAEQVTDALHGKYRNGSGMACCPAHREKNASMSISDGYSKRGEQIVMVKCFAGCDQDEVLDALESLGIVLRAKYDPDKVRPVRTQAPREAKPEPEATIDCVSMLKRWHVSTTKEQVRDLSESLGVQSIPLRAIKACRVSDSCWAFPMRDSKGFPIGIRLRFNDGSKKAITGSKAGLIYCTDFPELETVWICEGPTDTAAAMSLGLWAIGRPSCYGNEDMIVSLLRRVRAKRVIIISDSDRPGKKGSDKLRSTLKGIPHVMWIPPAKDIRQFLKDGGTRQMIDSMTRNLKWES